ncbi:uncharacterized protein [Procambarus clarkii]|uniref:uncharacterized protein n=1 Tax=Procambarus clarkii TaxID=6728 RepID=UPI0037449252
MSTKRECSPPLPAPQGRGGGSVEPCKLDEGFYIIDETKEMAQAVIEPFIAEVDAHEKGNLDWVRDIVQGIPTDERIIRCTEDNEYPFYLVENKVQKGGVEEYIHYLAIPKGYMEIRSLRHLRTGHIELLEAILEKSKKKFKEFGIPGEKLHIYIKYPPADWFLHVHFHAIYLTPEETKIAREKIDKEHKKGGESSSTSQDAGTAGASSSAAGTKSPFQVYTNIMIGKAHPLVTVISNLKMDEKLKMDETLTKKIKLRRNYYEDVTLPVSMKKHCLSLGCFYDHYAELNKPEAKQEYVDTVVLFAKTEGGEKKIKKARDDKSIIMEIINEEIKYNITEEEIVGEPTLEEDNTFKIKLKTGLKKFYLMKAARSVTSHSSSVGKECDYGVSEFLPEGSKKLMKELRKLRDDKNDIIKQLYSCNGIIKVLVKGKTQYQAITTEAQLKEFKSKYTLT